MASFKIMIQIMIALFLSLWTSVARFFTTVFRFARPKSATPVLPITVPRPHAPFELFKVLSQGN